MVPPYLVVAAEVVPSSGGATGLLLMAGLGAVAFLVGHMTRRFVSEVIVFLGIGILVGPDALNLVTRQGLVSLDPVIAVALGAIVFGIGERLELPVLRQIRATLLPIALLESVLVFFLALFGLLAIGQSLAVSYLLAAIAVSTSPTTLVAVIANKRARGRFTDHLMSATAVNNLVSAVLFGLGLPIVLAAQGTGPGQGLVAFGQLVGLSLVIGVAGAWVLRRFMAEVHSNGERLLFVLVVLLSVVAISLAVGAPVVISTLIAGALLANDARDTRPLFAALRTLEAPIFLVFFIVAGAGVHLDELASVGITGVVYVLARTIGKVAGGWGGAEISRAGRRAGWGPWIGAGLTPFAGMAIGLAAFTLEKATSAGLEELGGSVSAIVLGSVVVFELLGPIAVGRALDATGDAGVDGVTDDELDPGKPQSIDHILVPLSSPGMARRKAAQIVDLASSTGALLTCLHVVSPTAEIDPAGSPALVFVELVARARDVPYRGSVRRAESVVDAIVEETIEHDVDLVVLGEPYHRTLDRGGGRRIVHEVADRVPAHVRVLVIPTLEGLPDRREPVQSAPAVGAADDDPLAAKPGAGHR